MLFCPACWTKGRAFLAGKNGEYNYACPADKRFLDFAGVDPEEIKKLLAAGKGDREVLEWVQANAKPKRSAQEIADWSAGQEKRVPEDEDSRQFYQDILKNIDPRRQDVTTWFDLLDLDDYFSFGGKV